MRKRYTYTKPDSRMLPRLRARLTRRCLVRSCKCPRLRQTACEHVSSLRLANSLVLYGLVTDCSQIALVAICYAFLQHSLPLELSSSVRILRDCHELRLSASSSTVIASSHEDASTPARGP